MLTAEEINDFECFYRTHRPALIRQAQRLGGSAADANDLVHDTFERAFRTFGSFQPGTNGYRWLCTIMTPPLPSTTCGAAAGRYRPDTRSRGSRSRPRGPSRSRCGRR